MRNHDLASSVSARNFASLARGSLRFAAARKNTSYSVSVDRNHHNDGAHLSLHEAGDHHDRRGLMFSGDIIDGCQRHIALYSLILLFSAGRGLNPAAGYLK